jgi:AcrR family transcriptional regulator
VKRSTRAASGRATPKAEETRSRILAAALDLFQERGFSETTMRNIAQRAGVATGAAYYYFPSKESLVMAFYWQTHEEADRVVERRLKGAHDLGLRVRTLVELKLEQFRPYREFLGALFRSAGDPSSPLSPFGEETREIREQSITHFRRALEGSDVKVPADLGKHLPRLLWIYQMGIILFWIHDRSRGQTRTARLLEKTSGLIARAIRVSRFGVLKPLRNTAVELLESLTEDGEVGT